jgi:TPR repeat protein
VRKAAEQGLVAAEVRLAECYRDGRGVGRDAAQAAQWYRRAADAGDTTAQGTLGTMYAMGLGVERDDAEAYFWFDLAAGADGPNQQKYAANRQQVGTRITVEELAEVQRRVKKWRAAHGHKP